MLPVLFVLLALPMGMGAPQKGNDTPSARIDAYCASLTKEQRSNSFLCHDSPWTAEERIMILESMGAMF